MERITRMFLKRSIFFALFIFLFLGLNKNATALASESNNVFDETYSNSNNPVAIRVFGERGRRRRSEAPRNVELPDATGYHEIDEAAVIQLVLTDNPVNVMGATVLYSFFQLKNPDNELFITKINDYIRSEAQSYIDSGYYRAVVSTDDAQNVSIYRDFLQCKKYGFWFIGTDSITINLYAHSYGTDIIFEIPFSELSDMLDSETVNSSALAKNKSFLKKTVEVPDAPLDIFENPRRLGEKKIFEVENPETVTEWDATNWDEEEEASNLILVSRFENLSKLTLSVSNNNYDLTPLKALKKLTHLELILDADIPPTLKELTNISELSLSGGWLTEKDKAIVASLTHLTALNVTKVNLVDFAPFKNLKNLTKLNLSKNDINDLTSIKYFENLTELDLAFNDVKDLAPLQYLKNISNLKSLSLIGNRVTDVTPLGALVNLTGLDLGNNRITNVAPLSNLINLKYLNLTDNEVLDISPLKKIVGLREKDGKLLY
jgi:hypothetical protein